MGLPARNCNYSYMHFCLTWLVQVTCVPYIPTLATATSGRGQCYCLSSGRRARIIKRKYNRNSIRVPEACKGID